MPPLHNKLSLMKQFVTALGKELTACKFLQNWCLCETTEKGGHQEGILQEAHWLGIALSQVCLGFLGNYKAKKLYGAVETLVTSWPRWAASYL